MTHVTTPDGTKLDYERRGSGAPVILLHGGPFTRSINSGLAGLLADRFTVYTYDRRGRGDSGGDVADAAAQEFADLQAIVGEAGGRAQLYGSSGAGIIALQAAARGLPIDRLAVWEPPYSVVPGVPAPPADWGDQIAALIAERQRGDAVAYWMTTVTGMPAEVVAGMRQAPFWAALEAEAHGLVADHALIGDFSFPAKDLAAVRVPTLVMDGGPASFMAVAAALVARTVPDAQHKALEGQPHNVDDAAMAEALTEFFS